MGLHGLLFVVFVLSGTWPMGSDPNQLVLEPWWLASFEVVGEAGQTHVSWVHPEDVVGTKVCLYRNPDDTLSGLMGCQSSLPGQAGSLIASELPSDGERWMLLIWDEGDPAALIYRYGADARLAHQVYLQVWKDGDGAAES